MEQEKHFKTEAKALPNVYIIGIFLCIFAIGSTLEQDQVVIIALSKAVFRVTILSEGKETEDDRKGGIYA